MNGFAFQYFQKGIVFVNVKAQSTHINNATEQQHMTYDEAMEGYDVSAKQAKAEVLAHGVDWEEFVEEAGSKSVYKSNEVLEWLGY